MMSAYYDSEKDEIFGCEEGSFAWHHENRHRIQNKSLSLYPMLRISFDQLLPISIFAYLIKSEPLKEFLIQAWFIYLFVYYWAEIDAWAWAICMKIKDVIKND